MNDEDDPLHRRLTRLLAKTMGAEAINAPAWREGDYAGERRAHDDLNAGRLHWRAANSYARQGLEALQAGDRETAELATWVATDHYVAAIESRLRPSELEALSRSASRRGRRGKEK